jgi:hypothetical protein
MFSETFGMAIAPSAPTTIYRTADNIDAV